MPRWQNQPPDLAKTLPYRIIRVPSKGNLTGIITSPEMLGCNTHYVNNRTIPCEGEAECDACNQGNSYRWHCYVAILQTPGWEHAILELTAAASDPIRNYEGIHNQIRGCLIHATRPSGRPNGRVVINCKPADLTGIRLPDPPQIDRILCHLWGVKWEPRETLSHQLETALTITAEHREHDARYRVNQPVEPGNGETKKAR